MLSTFLFMPFPTSPVRTCGVEIEQLISTERTQYELVIETECLDMTQVSVGLSAAQQDAMQQLVELSQLTDNWDGYGGLPPCAQCIDNARQIIHSLAPYVSAPELTPNPNATITLEWETDEAVVSIEVGESAYSAFFETDGNEPLFSEGEYAGNLPEIVAWALDSLYMPVTDENVTVSGYSSLYDETDFQLTEPTTIRTHA